MRKDATLNKINTLILLTHSFNLIKSVKLDYIRTVYLIYVITMPLSLTKTLQAALVSTLGDLN